MSAPSRTAEKTAAASAKGPGENGRRVREQIQHRQVLSRSPLAPCYVTVAAGALLWGFETGIITDALLSITPAFGLDAQPAALGLVATTATMGSLCGTLTAGLLAERIGRRQVLTIAAACSLSGSIIASLFSSRLGALVVARVLAGYAIGIFATVVPMYAAECAATQERGAVMSLPQVQSSHLFVCSSINVFLYTYELMPYFRQSSHLFVCSSINVFYTYERMFHLK